MILRHKIFITFVFLVLVPMIIIWIVVHQIFISSKSEEVISNVENSIIQLNHNLDLMMEDSARSTLSLLYNRQLINILREYDITYPTRYKSHNHSNAFSLFLSGILFNKEHVYGIHVFTNNGQIFSHMDGYSIKDTINFRSQKWYKPVTEKNGEWIVYPQSNPSYYRNDNRQYISFIRLLKDPADHEEIGIIKVDFSPEYFSEITERLPGENWQVFSEGVPLFEKEMNNLLTKCSSDQGWIKDDNTGEEFLCLSHKSSETGLKVSNVIPKSYLYKEIDKFNALLASLIVLYLIISVVLSYYVANYLLKPLEALKNRIKDFKHDQMPNQIKIKSNGDIAELGGAYNNMLSEINYLVKEVYEMNIRNAESEYKALQSRMDPHFIFNTLESINMTAIKNKQLELSDMITELGRLIRYRLKNDEQQISLQEEIKFAYTYVSIMKRRLGEELEVHWELDDTANGYLVPKYIIQPLIENTFKHGYKNNNEKIHIYITTKLRQNNLLISVQDNGDGMESYDLHRIINAMNRGESITNAEEEENEKNGIALTNINKRLKLIYGINSKLSIHSEKGKGTQIDLFIPLEEGDNLEKSIAN